MQSVTVGQRTRQRAERSDALPENITYNPNTPCCADPSRLAFDCQLEECLLVLQDRGASQNETARRRRIADARTLREQGLPVAKIAATLQISVRQAFRDLSGR